LQFEIQITSCPVSGKTNSSALPAGGPGRTYFGKIFVINGEQSVVRELILWFHTCKIARATQAELLLFPGSHATQACKFVFSAIPEDSGDGDTHQDRADWSDRDWDDYNYAPPAGGAGCGQGAVMRDPLAELAWI
jgi:hypothetical protein